MTQRVSGLVKELGCVKSLALVKNGSLPPREIHSKKKKNDAQWLCKDLSCAVDGPVKEEETGRPMD